MRLFFSLLLCSIRHPRIALLGAVEFKGSVGMTYYDADDEYDAARSEAYDSGREAMHIVTRRRFDPSI